MKGIKLELFGIGIILLGIAMSTNNFIGYAGGIIGIIIVAAGFIMKDKENHT